MKTAQMTQQIETNPLAELFPRHCSLLPISDEHLELLEFSFLLLSHHFSWKFSETAKYCICVWLSMFYASFLKERYT